MLTSTAASAPRLRRRRRHYQRAAKTCKAALWCVGKRVAPLLDQRQPEPS
jgi:hypothetical protein